MSSPAWFGTAGIGPTGVKHRKKIPLAIFSILNDSLMKVKIKI